MFKLQQLVRKRRLRGKVEYREPTPPRTPGPDPEAASDPLVDWAEVAKWFDDDEAGNKSDSEMSTASKSSCSTWSSCSSSASDPLRRKLEEDEEDEDTEQAKKLKQSRVMKPRGKVAPLKLRRVGTWYFFLK